MYYGGVHTTIRTPQGKWKYPISSMHGAMEKEFFDYVDYCIFFNNNKVEKLPCRKLRPLQIDFTCNAQPSYKQDQLWHTYL